MSRLWLINAWRQHYGSQKQLLAGMQQAKLLGFDSYCSRRYGTQWWLCCAPVGARQQQQQDIVTAMRQQFQQRLQLVALLQQGQHWVCISWDQQQLISALAVANDDNGNQQLQLVLQGLWQREGFQPWCLLSSDMPSGLQRHFDQVPSARLQQFSLAQLQPTQSAQMVSFNQLPSWRRRRQLMLTTTLLLALITTLSWYFWPGSDQQAEPMVSAHSTALPSGMAVDTLLLVREQVQQLEFLAGWQIDQLTVQDAQLQVTLRQGYGRFGELQQQLQQHWQVTQRNQQVQLLRSLVVPPSELEFYQPLSVAQQQLQQQVLQLFPEARWQTGSSGASNQYRWQDLALRLDSWYWLELSDLQQLLQSFDVRLLSVQLTTQPQPQVAMQLRLYQPLTTGDMSASMDQGESHDTTMDVSTSNHL